MLCIKLVYANNNSGYLVYSYIQGNLEKVIW